MIDDLPTIKYPYSSLFALKSLSGAAENPFNATLAVNDGDEYWDGELEYRNLDATQQRDMRNFIIKKRGTAGEFWFVDYAHSNLGTWAGTPVVDGAGQDGTILAVKGLNANVTVGLYGDRFQLGDYLYELTSDAVTSGTGRVTLEFLPDLRVVPADNATLNVTNPRCKCMLQPNQTPPQATSKKALLSSFKFKFRESLR
jgi:hypothetical protein